MQVQSIKQSSKRNEFPLNLNKQKSYLIIPNNNKDEFHSLNKNNNKVSFGASIEYYARKYLHESNFESALESELWDQEVTWGQAIGDLFSNKATERVNSMIRRVQSKINEMKEAAAQEERRQQRIRDEIESERAYQRAETRRLAEQKEKLENELKVEKLNKQREALKIEGEKLDIEEQQLELDRKKLREERLSIYTGPIKSMFVNRAQVEKSNPEEKITAFPNGILLTGFNKKQINELVQWTVEKSECGLKTIDFSKLGPEDVLTMVLDAAKDIQQSGRRVILSILNFDKFTKNTPENQNIIPKLKAFLSCCADRYNCTVIAGVSDTKELAPEIIADQRFQVKVDSDSI